LCNIDIGGYGSRIALAEPVIGRTFARPVGSLVRDDEIDSIFKQPFPSWPGFVPAIHVFSLGMPQGVDARVKPGHDESASVAIALRATLARSSSLGQDETATFCGCSAGAITNPL
jgi:hypothetical protein